MPAAAQPHLGDNKLVVVLEYQVNLTEPASVVTFYELETLGAQVIECNLFGGPTLFRRAGHPLLTVDRRVRADRARRDHNRTATLEPRPGKLPVNASVFIGDKYAGHAGHRTIRSDFTGME